MDIFERLTAAGSQNSDQVDHAGRASNCASHLRGVADVALYQGNLSHLAQRLELQMLVGPAGDYPDAIAVTGEAPDDLFSDETGAAEYGDKLG